MVGDTNTGFNTTEEGDVELLSWTVRESRFEALDACAHVITN